MYKEIKDLLNFYKTTKKVINITGYYFNNIKKIDDKIASFICCLNSIFSYKSTIYHYETLKNVLQLRIDEPEEPSVKEADYFFLNTFTNMKLKDELCQGLESCLKTYKEKAELENKLLKNYGVKDRLFNNLIKTGKQLYKLTYKQINPDKKIKKFRKIMDPIKFDKTIFKILSTIKD